eukprot:3505524-Ditylum_brightwellii.AAC.1
MHNPNDGSRITQAARKIPNGFYSAGNKGIHAAPSAIVSNSMVTNHWTAAAPTSTGITKPDNVNSSYVTTLYSPDDVTSAISLFKHCDDKYHSTTFCYDTTSYNGTP